MKELDDFSLIDLAQCGNKEAENILLLRYNDCVTKTAQCFNSLNNQDDLKQEGLLALVRAIKSFDTSKNVSFKTYASRCIKNGMLDLLKKDNLSNDKIIFETDLSDTHKEQIDSLQAKDLTPEEVLIKEEDENLFFSDLKEILNDNESSVINLYLSAMSYREISDSLGMPIKQVDNTLAAAKKKLKKLINKIEK